MQQSQGGPHLEPQVRNLWDQIEKGLCIKRQSGSSLGEVLEGSLTCLRRTFELVGVTSRERVEIVTGASLSMVSAQ